MFYVYEYYIISTNEVFYVGKGRGNRYKNIWDRTDSFKKIIEEHKNDYNVRIVKYFENEDDAFSFENKLITFYKDEKNISLCNKDYGGLGGVSGVWTAEKRKYQSIHNPMKANEQRERMRLNNPSFKKETWINKAIRNNTIIYFYDKEYYTVKDFSNTWGISTNTFHEHWKENLKKIQEWIPVPQNSNGPFTKEEKLLISKKLLQDSWAKKTKYEKGKPISLFNVEYSSIQQVSDILKVGRDTILRWKDREEEIMELFPEFKGIKREITKEEKDKISFSSNKVKNSRDSFKRHLIIDNVEYSCANEASEKLNIKANTIRSRCKSSNFPNYYFLDNQQPSQ